MHLDLAALWVNADLAESARSADVLQKRSAFPLGKSLHAQEGEPSCGRSCTSFLNWMCRKKGMKKDEIHRRTRNVNVRFSPDEMIRVRALMEQGGYLSISGFIRDLALRKRFPDHRKEDVINDKKLLEKMNYLVYQVNKIGVNYNQVVAIWQKQSKLVKADGTPWMNTRSVEQRLEKLMSYTEGLRDEIAVILDVFNRYMGNGPSTNQ